MKRYILIVMSPIVIGVLVALCLWNLLKAGLYIYRFEFIINTIITCSATFSGFILTSVSVLIGLSNSPLMKHLRTTGSIVELQVRYTEALILGIALIIFCVVLGGCTGQSNIIGFWWAMSGICLTVAYLVSVVVSGYYMLRIIGQVPGKTPPKVNEKPSLPSGEFRLGEDTEDNIQQ